MGNLLKGDLDILPSTKKDVADCLATPLLNTIQINIISTILALAITIPLGIHCAVKKFSKFDNTVQVLTIVGYSMPQYIIALVFIFLFSVKLGWFPDQWYEYAELPGNRSGIRIRPNPLSGTSGHCYDSSCSGKYDTLCPCSHDRCNAYGLYPYRKSKRSERKVVIYSHAWRKRITSGYYTDHPAGL